MHKQIYRFCLFFALFCAFSAPAQTKHQRYLDYIERYKAIALQGERDYGVPASITLAQGLLESYVGQSKMALEANNHFGIKAYNWQGEVYSTGDCQVGYRKYNSPEDSFLDHALFLKGPRYSILYNFDVRDYRSWAQGLRNCGYAEDVNYPAKLISIIEQYELYALNGGKRMDGAVVRQEAEEETTDSGRWHHRKRRNRSQDTSTTTQPQQSERQETHTPLLQGRVPASTDN